LFFYFLSAGIAQIVILKLPLKYPSAELKKNLLLMAGGFLLVGIVMGQSSHHFAEGQWSWLLGLI
jgi:hypothetical protein